MESKIDELFGKLDRWRHFPAYQLERRADIFFSLYLPEILKLRFGRVPKAIIPEFPVRKGTIDPTSNSNQPFRIDYLAVMQDPLELIFVELKTDPASRNDDQDKYLLAAQEKGMPALLRGLLSIREATSAQGKYDQLLTELSDAGLIIRSADGGFEPNGILPKPEILYIQPKSDECDSRVISFEKVEEIVASHTDELSIRFAQSLRKWAEEPAGGKRGVRGNKIRG